MLSSLAISLPIISFAFIFLAVYETASRSANSERDRLFPVFLHAAILQAVFIALSVEILSLFHMLSGLWVSLVWLAWLLVWGWKVLKPGTLSSTWLSLLGDIRPPQGAEWVFAGLMTVILGLLLVTALVSPPNTTDSFLYHMSRVVHWAQNRSIDHYATGYRHQLYNPIWAEEAILHLRLLWGSDRLANLVQYFSMLGSLIGAAGITARLSRRALDSWAAAAFVISIPMGLLQATSTQNDYAAAFWLVCAAYFALTASQRSLSVLEKFSFFSATGLALLTKGTAYPYIVPFVAWYLLATLLRSTTITTLKDGSLLGLAVVALNVGFWIRNWVTFGGPLGPRHWVTISTGAGFGPVKIVVNLVRNLIMNFVTPFERLNGAILGWLQSAFGALDPQLASFRLIWNWNHEDLAGNPLHAALMILSLIALFLVYRRFSGLRVLKYGLVVFLSFIAMSAIVHTETYGLRFQLAFWVLWAPVFGCVAGWLAKPRLLTFAVILILIAAFPWVLFNKTRPLIAMRDNAEPLTIPCRWFGCTAIGSVLREPGTSILFANWFNLRRDYLETAAFIENTGCRQIGLRIDSSHIEYPIWWLLGAPQNGMRIETIYTYPELERYIDFDFKPCAVICTICSANDGANDRSHSRLHGLDLSAEFGSIRVYEGSGFQWELDSYITR